MLARLYHRAVTIHRARRMSAGVVALCVFVVLVIAPAPGRAQSSGGFIESPRLRFGLEVGAGGLVDAGGLFAFGFGGSARIGVQIDDIVAMFLATRVSGGVTHTGGSSAILFVGGVMIGGDVTIDDRYQVGLGVGIDGMSGSWCMMRAGPCFAEADPGFGLELRAAYMLAPWDYPMRGGFPVALAWHATLVPDVGLTSSITLSIGFELY